MSDRWVCGPCGNHNIGDFCARCNLGKPVAPKIVLSEGDRWIADTVLNEAGCLISDFNDEDKMRMLTMARKLLNEGGKE